MNHYRKLIPTSQDEVLNRSESPNQGRSKETSAEVFVRNWFACQ